jgi:hypothetical protein
MVFPLIQDRFSSAAAEGILLGPRSSFSVLSAESASLPVRFATVTFVTVDLRLCGTLGGYGSLNSQAARRPEQVGKPGPATRRTAVERALGLKG